jgi:signal transduction histidine kinase
MILAFLILITSICALCLAIFVYVKNRNSMINRRFAVMSLLFSLWIFLNFLGSVSDNILVPRLFYAVGSLLLVSVLIFTSSFCGIAIPRPMKRVFWGLGFLFFILSFTKFFIKEIYSVGVGSFEGQYGPGFYFWCIYLLAFVGTSIIVFIKVYLRSQGLKKLQIKYLAIGFIATGVVVIIVDIALPLLGKKAWMALDSPSSLLYLVFTAYAILRYRLMDINVVLTRAGIFIVVYSFVLGIPLLIGYKTKAWLPSTALAIFFASFGPYLYNRIKTRAEHLLLKEQYRYQEALRDASRGMIFIKDLNSLLRITVALLKDTFALPYAGIYLFHAQENIYKLEFYSKSEGTSYLPPFEIPKNSTLVQILFRTKNYIFSSEQDMSVINAGLILPLFTESNLIGFVFLSDRPKGKIYTPGDLSVLEALANQTSIAVTNIASSQERDYFKSLGILSAGLAHEIKTPLTAIKTFGGYLPSRMEDKTFLNEYNTVILSESDRINYIVENLLDFANPPKLVRHPVDLIVLLGEVLSSFTLVFKDKHITLTKEFPKAVLQAPIDKERFTICLTNLISNAIDAMKESPEKHLTVILKKEYPYALITIKDTGKGIPQENIPYIFDPFYSTKDTHKGLGLAITKRIIEQHDGFIEVESQEGRGTCFMVGIKQS